MSVSPPTILVQKVDIFYLGRYNTNNYPVDAILNQDTLKYQTQVYEEEIQRTNLKRYVHHLNNLDPANQWTEVKLSDKTLNILKKFNGAGWRSGHLVLPQDTDSFDELWSCVEELKQTGLFDGRRWFFRFSRNSPKDGIPSFPVLSEYDVLEKIATSARASFALEYGDDTLYLKPYREDIDICDEFRVFIHSRKMTAISTYTCEFTEYTMMSEQVLTHVARRIYEFWRSLDFLNVLPESYTMDVSLPSPDEDIYLIEFNTFGYWLPASSCLFDWLNDYDTLYSDGSQIVFRLANLF